MNWRLTRKKMFAIILILFLALCAAKLAGCSNLTRKEEREIKTTAGQVGGMFGLPPYVGESIAGLILTIASNIEGQRRGRKKERSCHVAKPASGT